MRHHPPTEVYFSCPKKSSDDRMSRFWSNSILEGENNNEEIIVSCFGSSDGRMCICRM
jgi:hypothetical protein